MITTVYQKIDKLLNDFQFLAIQSTILCPLKNVESFWKLKIFLMKEKPTFNLIKTRVN